MATTATTATDGKPLLSLPQHAPRPPFVWSAHLPTTWRFIDVDPARTDASVANLLRDDDLVPGVRLSSAQRRAMQQSFKEMATQAREAGILLALVLPGVDNGEISAVPLLLRWIDTAPAPASVLSAQQQLGAKAEASVASTNAGGSFLLASEQGLAGPLTQRRTVYHHQAFVPIASSTWTLAISSTAPSEDVSAEVRDIVVRVASSVVAHTDLAASEVSLGDGVEPQNTIEIGAPDAGLSRVVVRDKEVYDHVQ